jgi:hypothetical protein
MKYTLQYPSPLCRLIWAVTHVIGLHIKLTTLGECDVALTTILDILLSNVVLIGRYQDPLATDHSLVGLKKNNCSSVT